MDERILSHYRACGAYTCAGAYADCFRALPSDPRALGELISRQIIHRVTLLERNGGANADLRYGDMGRYPWHRLRCEDDLFLTAPAIAAELFRRDARGFVPDRAVEDRLVLTCRYVSVLVSAIYKAKGIPCRSRAGFAPYFQSGASMDHWINEVWCGRENRWILFDADGLYDEDAMGIRQYDMDYSSFDFAADAWLSIREGKTDGKEFLYADGLGTCSIQAVARYLVFDFHALMNDEISYRFQPLFAGENYENLSEDDLRSLDALAELMRSPDENFDKLRALWESERKFRQLSSPLVGASDYA